MSCARGRNTCRTVAKVGSGTKRVNVECALREAHSDDRLEYLFQKTVRNFKNNKTVNIDYANEYLTRGRESDLGTLSFFIVDDLLDTLNLDATKKVFEAESGFQLKKIKNADTIHLMFQLAENVKLLDTVAEKVLDWYWNEASRAIEEHVWTIWDLMNLSEYIRMYKEMYESMPGDEARSFYETTSLHALLHHCHPERTAHVIEYTVSNAEPVPVCGHSAGAGGSRASQLRGGSQSRKVSSANIRKAAQNVRKRASTVHRV